MRLGVLDVGSNSVELQVVDGGSGAPPLETSAFKHTVRLAECTGADEARFTFLAARRRFGWSARPLLVLDIGGGSLEVACGRDEEPDVAVSHPQR